MVLRGGGVEGKESIHGFHNELQGKKEQITALMEDPEIFKELGILIDPEVVTKIIRDHSHGYHDHCSILTPQSKHNTLRQIVTFEGWRR